MDIDDALKFVGGYRRWNLTIFVLLGISLFLPLAWQGLAIVFIAWEPPHWCKLDLAGSVNNITAHIPMVTEDNGELAPSKCSRYINASLDNSTTTCSNGWTYDNQGYYTVVEQWDLVCQHNYVSDISQSMYHLGCLFAEVVFSYLVDRYGRKLVHIVSHLGILVVGVAIAFSNSFVTFIVLRTLLGMITVACVNSGLTECMELFDSEKRAIAGIGLEFQWIFCYLTLPILTYFIGDWRILHIVMSVTSIIWIIYFWILPESPIWLVAAGRYQDAEKTLHQIARWNGVQVEPNTQLLSFPENQVPLQLPNNSFPNHDLEETPTTFVTELVVPAISVQSQETERKSPAGKKKTMSVPLKSLVTDKHLRLHLIICGLFWLANCFVYYALILSTPSLAGNRFINFLIMGLVELPAAFLALYTTQVFGRRIPTCVYHIIAGVPLAFVAFIPHTTASGVDLSGLIVTLVMVSKFGISASFSVVILYSKELFPTNLRGTSSGVCQVFGRIGSILAPMAAYATKTSYHWIPNLVFGIASIGVGLLTLVLPETAGHPLPQTLEDVRRMATGSPPAPPPSGFSGLNLSDDKMATGRERNLHQQNEILLNKVNNNE